MLKKPDKCVAIQLEIQHNINMTAIYRNIQDIKACVTARWKHKNCKFQRGDHAEVSAQVLPRDWVHEGRVVPGRSYVSQRKQRRVGRVGEVVAVSCINDGTRRIRSSGYDMPSRMHTRYYIQFRDGVIMGFDSHHLNKAFGS